MIRSNVDAIGPDLVEYRLPSGGLLYRKLFPNFPKTASISSFTFRTEAILAASLSTKEKMARVTREVFTNLPEGFPIGNLIEEDQMVVLALARGQTFGESYHFSTICPACENRESHEMRVPEELPVKNWDYPDYETFEKAITLELPVTKDVVKLSFPTIGESPQPEGEQEPAKEPAKRSGKSVIVKGAGESKVAKKLSEDLPKEGLDLLRAMARSVDTVNGTTADSLEETVEYLLKLPGKDRVAFQEFREKAACGIDYNVRVKCDKCKNQFTSFLPIAGSFFRRSQ